MVVGAVVVVVVPVVGVLVLEDVGSVAASSDTFWVFSLSLIFLYVLFHR